MLENKTKRAMHPPGGSVATEEQVVTAEREEHAPVRAYESPRVTVIEVPMERGYAASISPLDNENW